MIWNSNFLSGNHPYDYLVYVGRGASQARAYLDYHELKLFYKKLKLIGILRVNIYSRNIGRPITDGYVELTSFEHLQSIVSGPPKKETP